jgi:hypothetical protein
MNFYLSLSMKDTIKINHSQRHFDEGEISCSINRLKFMRCLVPRHDEHRGLLFFTGLNNENLFANSHYNKKFFINNNNTSIKPCYS